MTEQEIWLAALLAGLRAGHHDAALVNADATLAAYRKRFPAPEENICEHGDHPATDGQRYCSAECKACDMADCNEDEECAGICQGPLTAKLGEA